MSTPLKSISVFLQVLLLVLGIDAKIGVSKDNCRIPANCSREGPPIRFPFRLKGQPEYCGSFGFEVSCTGSTNQTILELPSSEKLRVEEINYRTREIRVHYKDSCLSRQLNFSLAPSPFKLRDGNLAEDFTFFSCSLDKSESDGLTSYTCNILGNTTVYAVSSGADLGDLDLYSCQRVDNVIIPQMDLENAFYLKWADTTYGGFKTEKAASRIPKVAAASRIPKVAAASRIPKVAAASRIPKVAGIILGCLFLVSIASALYHVYSLYKSQREHGRKIEKFLEDYRALKPSRYSYADIKKITHGFDYKLGQGAYGTVYKGKLSNEVFVAVKVLNDSKGNGVEFINEVATMIPEWVYNHLNQGEELHIRIEEEGDAQMAKKLTIVGLWCIQWHPVDRPSMNVVVQMLGEDNLIMPPNPFTTTDRIVVTDQTRINASKPPRTFQQKLEVISELE